jgi:transcriptional regulator with XRE-family HTH domain
MKKVRITTGLGHRIAVARKHAGLSQTDLGKAFGITRSSVSQWESETTEPTPSNLRAIAVRCGVGYEWLASGSGIMTKVEDNSKLAKVTRLLSEADPEVLDAVELFLHRMQSVASQEPRPVSRGLPPTKRK